MSRRKAAARPPEPKRPAHWDKRVSAAYLRIMGATQKQAAEAVGRAERTLREWEAHPSWPAARAEAEERWLANAVDASRRAVLRTIEAGNAEFGFRLLERADSRLAPPKQQHEHAGKGGGPIQVEVYGYSDAGEPDAEEEP